MYLCSAGTTRDAVRVKWSYKNRPVQLVDTAGITRLAYWDSSALIDSVAVAAATKASVDCWSDCSAYFVAVITACVKRA